MKPAVVYTRGHKPSPLGKGKPRAKVLTNWRRVAPSILAKATHLPDDMLEDEFQHVVLAVARFHGWMAVHFRPAMRQSGEYSTPVQGVKGFPDLQLAREGVVLLAELKTNRGGLKPEQRAWRTHLESSGLYRLWRPRDWNTVRGELANRRAA